MDARKSLSSERVQELLIRARRHLRRWLKEHCRFPPPELSKDDLLRIVGAPPVQFMMKAKQQKKAAAAANRKQKDSGEDQLNVKELERRIVDFLSKMAQEGCSSSIAQNEAVVREFERREALRHEAVLHRIRNRAGTDVAGEAARSLKEAQERRTEVRNHLRAWWLRNDEQKRTNQFLERLKDPRASKIINRIKQFFATFNSYEKSALEYEYSDSEDEDDSDAEDRSRLPEYPRPRLPSTAARKASAAPQSPADSLQLKGDPAQRVWDFLVELQEMMKDNPVWRGDSPVSAKRLCGWVFDPAAAALTAVYRMNGRKPWIPRSDWLCQCCMTRWEWGCYCV